jgi:SOS response regulatory protein OraA/RecX
VAVQRAEALAGRGFGDAAIRYDLEQEGLAAELVEEALAGLEPEPERARALVERRGAELRTVRWLAARGFDAATVEDVLSGFAEDA